MYCISILLISHTTHHWRLCHLLTSSLAPNHGRNRPEAVRDVPTLLTWTSVVRGRCFIVPPFSPPRHTHPNTSEFRLPKLALLLALNLWRCVPHVVAMLIWYFSGPGGPGGGGHGGGGRGGPGGGWGGPGGGGGGWGGPPGGGGGGGPPPPCEFW